MMKKLLAGLAFALFALVAHAAGIPENYPADYKNTLAAA